MSENRFTDADDLSLRVEHVCDLASLLGSSAMDDKTFPEPMEWLDDDWPDEKSFFGRAKEELLPILTRTEEPEAWQVGENLIDSGHRGFLVQVSTPVMKPRSSTVTLFSWGHKYLQWVYGDTFEEAWEEAKRWAIERHERDAKKGGAA